MISELESLLTDNLKRPSDPIPVNEGRSAGGWSEWNEKRKQP